MSAAAGQPSGTTVWAADLGGTHLTTAAVDVASARLRRDPVRIDLPERADREGLLDVLATALSAGAHLPTWSLAVPGPFDLERGVSRVTGLAKLEALYGIDLRTELRRRTGSDARVVFLNDAHAFGLGEWWIGAAREHDRVIGITLGTGLGSVFLDRGRRVAAGPQVPTEGWLYHLPVDDRIADDVISSRGILRAYGREDLTVRDIAERARNGDQRAAATFAETASTLGRLIAPWVRRFGATCVVVGGGVVGAWDLLAPSLDAGPAVVVRAAGAHPPLFGAARHALGIGHDVQPS